MQTLTIILPCYKPPNSWNEIFKQNNQLVLQKFSDIQLSILVVDDGSQDNDLKNTLECLQKENSNFRFIGYPENQGKGYALRKGVSAVTSDYYIITDIDFPYTTSSIAAILETLQQGANVAVGFRGNVYYQATPLPRKILSKLFRTILVLTIWITLTSTIHLYFLAIQAMFLVIYALFRTLFGNATILNSVRLIVLGTIIPFGLILFWTKLVANVPDRPENPYGFLAYRALWEGFFLHPNTFLHQLIEKLGIQIRPIDDFETIGYCGIAAALTTLILIFRGIFLLQVKKWFSALNNLPDNVKTLRIMLLAAFVLGLFAHGIPFIIPGLDFLMDYLGPLKQFRSIARFMWVYYWVINIFLAIEIYRWLSAKNIKQPILSVILVIIGFIPIIEARASIFIPVYQPIIKYDLMDKQRDFAHYYLSKPKKYPALIVPLPGIQAGCEWIGREINLPIAVQTLMLSLRTGVPTTAAQLSRTSQRQCIEQFQTGQELTYPATIFNNLPDSASVWMATPQKINPYNEPGWNFLTLHSNTIYSDTSIKILEIKNFKQHYLEAHKLQQQKLLDKYTFLQKNTSLIRGESLPIKSQNNFLYEGTPTVQDTATNWIFSFWMEVPKRAVTGFMINIESKQFNQKHLQQHNISPYMQYVQEGWALFEVPIQYQAGNPLIISYIYNKQPIEFHFKWASLRPHQYSFIENKDGVRLFNGRQILVND